MIVEIRDIRFGKRYMYYRRCGQKRDLVVGDKAKLFTATYQKMIVESELTR